MKTSAMLARPSLPFIPIFGDDYTPIIYLFLMHPMSIKELFPVRHVKSGYSPFYKTRPSPAMAKATSPRATSKPEAPLPESEVALAVAEESVLEPVAKPVWTAVSEVVEAVKGTVEDVDTVWAATVLLVDG
jgi:hypothetical protein